MGYLESILDEDERIVHRATIHWVAYVPALIVLALAAVLFGLAIAYWPEPGWKHTAALVGAVIGLVVALYFAAAAFIKRWTTEIAVTDRRVITKTGLISRDTSELDRRKVETVRVDQSLMGRIMGYGTITVSGTGGGLTPLKDIDDPLEVRKHIRPV